MVFASPADPFCPGASTSRRLRWHFEQLGAEPARRCHLGGRLRVFGVADDKVMPFFFSCKLDAVAGPKQRSTHLTVKAANAKCRLGNETMLGAPARNPSSSERVCENSATQCRFKPKLARETA